MAEVQRRLEVITVEIEELTQLGFFSEEECSTLVKKQFEFENKINSMNKCIQDFKEYIAYVISLFRIIKTRRNKVKIGDKKHNLEYRVLQRIKNLYEMASTRFPLEVDFFFAFFEFCKEAKFRHATKKMCEMMLKFHKNMEEAWLTAARLYFHVRKDHHQAIKLLQEGIGIHPASSLLYKECIEYEVISATKETLTDDDTAKLVAKLEIYFKQAKKHVTDYSFYTYLLTFLPEYTFSIGIQIDLINFLKDSFKDCVNVWQYLATRELEGLHTDMEKEEIVVLPTGKAFMNCISTYEEGLANISKENEQELWNLYLQCIADFRYRKDFNKVPNFNRLAINAFEKAAAEGFPSDTLFLVWLDLVSDDKKVELLKYATARCPNSVDLWTLRLRIDIASSKLTTNAVHLDVINDNIEETFSLGCQNLMWESLPLWEAFHDYKFSIQSDDQDMKEFYLKALTANSNVASVFKPKYVSWLGQHESIDEARNVYKTLVKVKPFSKEMYQVMLELELGQNPINVNELEFLHKSACEQIGAVTSDVWLDYVKFCLEYKTIRDGKDIIAKILVDAKKKLGFDSDFQEKYDDIVETVQKKKLCIRN